jgi:hypothetical protein
LEITSESGAYSPMSRVTRSIWKITGEPGA